MSLTSIEPAPRAAGSSLVPLAGPELLRLMQLSSSLCPIGAFAFSQGLEQAVERGWVGDEAATAEWLLGLGRHTLARLDLPLLLQAHAAWQRDDVAQALRIGERVLANREARELWEQERDLGRALACVLDNLQVRRAVALREARNTSYVIAYALGAAHFDIQAELAAFGYAYAWSEQQSSAAARLVPLGHMAAQRVLSRALADVPAWVRQAALLDDEQIGSVVPGLAMAAAWHETQYSRLFRS